MLTYTLGCVPPEQIACKQIHSNNSQAKICSEIKDVTFCAYKKSHPLENFIVLKIVTKDNMTPIQALDSSLKDLYIELSVIEEEFKGVI